MLAKCTSPPVNAIGCDMDILAQSNDVHIISTVWYFLPPNIILQRCLHNENAYALPYFL